MSVVTGTGMRFIVDMIVTGPAGAPVWLLPPSITLLPPPLTPVPVPVGPAAVPFPIGKGAVPIGAPDGRGYPPDAETPDC